MTSDISLTPHAVTASMSVDEAQRRIAFYLRRIDECWAVVQAGSPALQRGSGVLTEAELQVARLAAWTDLTAAAIAAQRHLSESTVRGHLKGIYRKLSVCNRDELRVALLAAERVPAVAA